MTRDALLQERKLVSEKLLNLSIANLDSFHNAYMSLYENVIFEYTGANEDSEFYHIKKALSRMSDFSSVSDKKKSEEILYIKSTAMATMRDFEKIILKM